MRKALAPLALLPLVALLTGCPPEVPTWTVSGTITSYSMNLAPSATISVSAGNLELEKTVTVTGSGTQTGTYSFSSVASYHYDISVTVETLSASWPANGVDCILNVHGSDVSQSSSDNANPKTFTFTDIEIMDSTEINITLQSPLGGGH